MEESHRDFGKRGTSRVKGLADFPKHVLILSLICLKSILAIRPIKNAMLRLDPSSSTFTSTHLLFACLCLESRSYRSALPILDNSIYHFPGTQDKATLQKSQQLLCAEHRSSSTYITVSSGLSAKLVYRDHLEYFLYGAMIYMGLKKWAKALTFLEVVIVAPTNNVASMIMVEAYKKWVLVGLLETGRVRVLQIFQVNFHCVDN